MEFLIYLNFFSTDNWLRLRRHIIRRPGTPSCVLVLRRGVRQDAGRPILFYPDFCSLSRPASWGLSFLAGKPVLHNAAARSSGRSASCNHFIPPNDYARLHPCSCDVFVGWPYCWLEVGLMTCKIQSNLNLAPLGWENCIMVRFNCILDWGLFPWHHKVSLLLKIWSWGCEWDFMAVI